MNDQQRAVNFFIKHTLYRTSDIQDITQIHNGFTNTSFKFKTRDRKVYQVRLSKQPDVVDRINEHKVIKAANFDYFVYYEPKSGNAIKKWIRGVNPSRQTISSTKFLASFTKELSRLHKIKVTDIKQHDYLDCMNKNILPKRHYEVYMRLINKYAKLPLVLSHNDLSSDNLLWSGAKVIFIDYEWARMNNKYWDLANFIRETGLPEKQIKLLAKLSNIKDITTLRAFIYIATNYAYQWTHKMPQTKQILAYRKLIKRRLKDYYQRYTAIKSLI